MRALATSGSVFEPADAFVHRHLGPNDAEITKMLSVIGESSLNSLIDKTIPKSIRRSPMTIPAQRTEQSVLAELKKTMSQNRPLRSMLGMGYHDTVMPSVILRNLFENPGWYTPYTPYQAEISQGRLEMLMNFQTMVADLTGLAVANASLLDEATAAAEAMAMCYNAATDKDKTTFLVSSNVHPQTIGVLNTRSAGYGVTVRVANTAEFDAILAEGKVFGVLVQYPGTDGTLEDYAPLASRVHASGALVVAATDLLALTLIKPPGEWGADVAIGSAQRFGVPLGYGGPHAAFFATRDEFKRKMPGRVIGLSRDSRGQPAYRMAMQTREQHIRRDKATSNICTAQALLANVAGAYGVYHGPEGLRRIAHRTWAMGSLFSQAAAKMGFAAKNSNAFFDTLAIDVRANGGASGAEAYRAEALKRGFLIRVLDDNTVGLSFDETTTLQDLQQVADVFADVRKAGRVDIAALSSQANLDFPEKFSRTSPYMRHPVFSSYRTETEMMRYLYALQMKDLSLATAMIPLGSCTMKLNAASEMIPITWPEVTNVHPFAPPEATKGYADMLSELERSLCDITGFAAVSLQPNAGSQGEFAGLLAIQAYHKSRGQGHRNICLIPKSAHGTNPASAAMAGLRIVEVACDAKGNVDVADLKKKAQENAENLSCLMITYPSTHGVFEEAIMEIVEAIHSNGGQVYMDGANMNAQVGLTSPGRIGADVCHLNLHKTFCIPHGGGGPGMGPIGVAKHLVPFLPSGSGGVGPVSAAPFSSASILPISYVYIKLMGRDGLTKATEVAILNANYMMARLKPHFDILYTGKNGTVAHEFIIDVRKFKASAGIVEEDIAKRLLDYNFHAPTVSFPVPGTLMVEPTESESLAELDRFCDALIAIRAEIADIESGKASRTDNVLKNSPHTHDMVTADKWEHPYSREQAAYPIAYLRDRKFWPAVGRLDNVYGDRNFCSCLPLEAYKV